MSIDVETMGSGTLSKQIYNLELEDIKISSAISELIGMLSEPGEFQELFTYLKTIRQLAFVNFAHEESIMLMHAQEHYKSHTKDHAHLLEHIDGLIAMLELANGYDEVSVVSVNEFITKWFAKHAMYFDGPMIDALKAI